MNFLAKELKLMASKSNNDEVKINARTKEFIEAIKNNLKNIVLDNSETTKTSKPILMDIPKDSDIDDLLLWLNLEKIPFTVNSEYRNGSLYINRLSLLVKDIKAWVNTNG